MNRMRGFLSIDIDVSELEVNQCEAPPSIEFHHMRSSKTNHYDEIVNQIVAFHDSHKCHLDSMMVSMIVKYIYFSLAKKNENILYCRM